VDTVRNPREYRPGIRQLGAADRLHRDPLPAGPASCGQVAAVRAAAIGGTLPRRGVRV